MKPKKLSTGLKMVTVWCLNKARKVGVAVKLQHTYHGPFLVLEKVNDANFVIQMDKDGKKVLLHHDELNLMKEKILQNGCLGPERS